ncbi:amidase [Pseudoruegeria sp. HB172150]|uniref:amidase n=1 Tax=Pseudoruegeria sp. HB172150 TaxID=2721164 RepID=UPI001556B3AB|nr:amidase [Pseudoruegeria sp. HB172150]
MSAQGDIAQLAAAYRSGTSTPRDVVEAALERIAERNPVLNAFADPMADQARAAADAATTELRAGIDRGPLHGIPISVKDLIEVRGALTGYGSRVIEPAMADSDALLIARLRAAGAVILGKTQLLEYAYGIAHPEIGQTNNPHDPSRTAGGSSGGSAAAVADGIVPAAIGTDTGGSIRIPAAYCGIVGVKPSYGLVPLDVVFPLSWTLDHAGPLARTVGDAALVLGALAGHVFALSEVPANRIRLGVLRQHFPRDAGNLDVGTCMDDVLKRLQRAGVDLVEVHIPELGEANAALLDILLPEASVIHRDLYSKNPGGYAAGTRRQIEAGFDISATTYVEARRTQSRVRAAVDAALAGVNALVSPAVPFVAPHEDPEIADGGDSEMLASGFANLTGHPSLSLPVGRASRLPVGLQMTGSDDLRLLSLAASIEVLIAQPVGSLDSGLTGSTR